MQKMLCGPLIQSGHYAGQKHILPTTGTEP